MPARNNRCGSCGGSGKCESCFGSGTNVHLGDPEPKCRACKGTGRCAECGGKGKIDPAMFSKDLPIALRLLFSVLPVFYLWRVWIAHGPVRAGGFGRVGPELPHLEGCIFATAICGLILYGIWGSIIWDKFRRG